MRGRRGSMTFEYAGLIAVIAAALLTMSVYILRAVCGKWREVGNAIGNERQYEFGVTRIDGEIR